MTIESLPSDTKLSTKLGDLGLGLTHRGLGEPELGGRHLERTPAMSVARARGGKAGAGTLDDQLALEFGEAGEDREDQPTVGGGGVDRRAFASQHLEADATLRQVADCVDEVAQITAEPVELPDDERVVAAQRLQAGIEAGPLVEPARCAVLIDMLGIDAGRDQRVALKVVNLAAIRLGHSRVTNLRCHIYVRLRDGAALPVD